MDLENTDVRLEVSLDPFRFGDKTNATLLITGNADKINKIVNQVRDLTEAVGFYEIEKVIYNPPATIVLWKDKTKTIVKCHKDDVYDKEIGLLKCIVKKAYGNNGRYNDIIRKFVDYSERKANNNKKAVENELFESVLRSMGMNAKILSDKFLQILDDLE